MVNRSPTVPARIAGKRTAAAGRRATVFVASLISLFSVLKLLALNWIVLAFMSRTTSTITVSRSEKTGPSGFLGCSRSVPGSRDGMKG